MKGIYISRRGECPELFVFFQEEVGAVFTEQAADICLRVEPEVMLFLRKFIWGVIPSGPCRLLMCLSLAKMLSVLLLNTWEPGW